LQEHYRTLGADQRRRIEELANAKGITCNGCGSGDLSCAEEARRTFNHGARVELHCSNAAHHQDVSGFRADSVREFILSPEEAQALGL
jgi:hypothetical protein